MNSAVLLIDLQRDFLAGPGARLPVSEKGTAAVLTIANEILQRRLLPDAVPIMIANEYSPDAAVMNALRRDAAIVGSRGADLDARLADSHHVARFSKSSGNAFTNPNLDKYLERNGIEHLYVLGVKAEACVKATVMAAIRRGYRVTVIANAVASSSDWLVGVALWLMQRGGAEIVQMVPAHKTSANWTDSKLAVGPNT